MLHFTLGVAYTMGLDKYMTHVHHYSITQNVFIALKILIGFTKSPLPTP